MKCLLTQSISPARDPMEPEGNAREKRVDPVTREKAMLFDSQSPVRRFRKNTCRMIPTNHPAHP